MALCPLPVPMLSMSQTGTTGWQQLPLLIYQPENNFSYIMPGGRLGVSSRSGASHPIFAASARIVLVGFIHRAPQTQVPTALGGLSAHHRPPRGFILSPMALGTYLHGGPGAGPPGLLSVGCSAASPRWHRARQRRTGCHGRGERGSWRQQSFWGAAGREGRSRTLLQTPPAGLSPCPQPRPASSGMEPMVRRDCRLRKSAGAVYGFQGCNANPPSSPWRDIPPPPAPYAACALMQGLTPAIVICCVTHQDREPGRRTHKAKPCTGLMCREKYSR